ncbi:tripartite motif-containing protein 45-like [Patella vulgata]|uniref:tripartite motif-containing protein 45-like n=1 Tax=Patella vulgata TaxID=6465 RepID=UPI00217FA803|nr:tripartite motif-containing protein 45-like [Patella vulgata]
MAEHNRHVCSICLNNFVKPKIIDCHHTYCLHCLQDYVKKSAKNNKFLCPLCRMEIEIPEGGVNNFSTNIYIEGVCVKKQIKTDIPACDICVKVQSQFRCSDCEQYMCQSCKITHDSLAGCRSHVFFSLNDNADDKLQRRTFCKKHISTELEFYCRDCKTSICMKCLMSKHKDHNTPDLKDFIEETRKILAPRKDKMEGNLTKLKSELETIQCKISNERKHLNHSCEIVDRHVQAVYATLVDSGNQVKNKMEAVYCTNELKLEDIKIPKVNAIRDLEASISYTEGVLKTQSIEEMLKLSRDIKSIPQVKETDENFTLPDLQLYRLNAIETVTRPVSSLAHGTVIYFDSNGKARDQKQCYTKTRWETMCRFIYYYYRLMYCYYLMSFPWIYPIYLIIMCFKVLFGIFVWVRFMRWLGQPEYKHKKTTFFEDATVAYNWVPVAQQFNYCICNIFSNTEGFEVNFSKDDLQSGMCTCRSPDYIRYGCRWYIVLSSDSKVVDLQICRDNHDCCGDTLFGIRIVDAYGFHMSLTKIDRYGHSSSCYNWPRAIKLKNLCNEKFKIQIVIFEKDEFIYR